MNICWREIRILTLVLTTILAAGCASLPTETSAPEPEALELVRAFPIEAMDGEVLEPSGLCLFEGSLFSISDKASDTIYRVVFRNDYAIMEPYLHFVPPVGSGALDLEGITVDDEGVFYLASEAYSRVLRVTPDGQADWLFESVFPAGRKEGLFRARNAHLEGITLLENGNFLLAAERHPRGLIEMDGKSGDVVRVQNMNSTRFDHRLSLMRPADWTGLEVFDGRVYALFRNANLIVELERDDAGDFHETDRAWDYRHVEESGVYRYDDLRFGKGEGLAIDKHYIYVVLDNNQRPQAIDRDDFRPLLFVFINPLQAAAAMKEPQDGERTAAGQTSGIVAR